MVFFLKNYIFIMALFAVAWVPCYLVAAPSLRRHIGAPFVACYALSVLAGFFLPNSAFFFIFVVFLMAITVRDRLDAICRYVLLVVMLPAPVWPLTVGGSWFMWLETKDALTLALPLICLAHREPADRRPRLHGVTPEDWLALLLFAIMFFAERSSTGTAILRSLVTQGTTVLIPYLTLRRYARDARDFRVVVACLAVAAVVLSVYAVFEVRTGWSIFDSMTKHLGDSTSAWRNANQRGGRLRSSTTMSLPLMMAFFMVLGVGAIACSRDFLRNRGAYAAALALAMLGVLAPQSRGNLLCLAVAVLLLFVAWRRYGLAFVGLIGATVGGGVLYVLAHSVAAIGAFFNIDPTRAAGEDYDYRQVLLRRGWQEALQHPFFGESTGRAIANMSDIKQGEGIVDMVNSYLSLLIASGAAGMVPLLCLIAAVTGQALSPVDRSNRDLVGLRAFCLSAWVAVLLELSFMSLINRVPLFIMFVLVGCRVLALERRRGAAARPASARSAVPAFSTLVLSPPIRLEPPGPRPALG